MKSAWKGWAMYCLALPIAGILILLTVIPGLIGAFLELFHQERQA